MGPPPPPFKLPSCLLFSALNTSFYHHYWLDRVISFHLVVFVTFKIISKYSHIKKACAWANPTSCKQIRKWHLYTFPTEKRLILKKRTPDVLLLELLTRLLTVHHKTRTRQRGKLLTWRTWGCVPPLSWPFLSSFPFGSPPPHPSFYLLLLFFPPPGAW